MKNYGLPILTLIALLLLSGRVVIAQTQFELSQASSSTTTTGPTTAVQSATLLENTTGTTFVAATPTTTVSLSLSNQQYVGTYGNITTGVVYGALASNSSANVGSIPVYQLMNSVGGPANASFTSSPCGPAGTGINVAANYGFRLFASTKPLRLANAAVTGRYRYTDITLTFNRPVDNPVLQIVGLGGNFDGGTLVATQYFTAELELLTTGVTLSELSGSTELSVTADNKILNTSTQPDATCGAGAACGSVRATGTGITSLTFRVYIRGVGGSIVAGIGPSVWDGTAAHAGDGFIIGVSLDKAPTPTATTLTNICPATTANLTTIQPSSSTALEWHTVATNPSAATKVSTPTAVGAGTYYLYAMNGTNCYSPASVPVTVTIQTVTATLSSATICNGTSATLTATGGSSYRFSEGTTNTTGILIVSPTTNGSNPYSVTVTLGQACAVASGTVTVSPSVTATLSSATICNGTSATLTATGGSNYRFSEGTTNTTGVLVVAPTVNGSNPYSVTVTSAQGCSAVATGTVTVNASVTATLSSATICNGASTTLTATGGSNYRFSTGQTGTGNILVVSPTTNGANPYSVTVTSAQGCSAVATGTVTVNPSVTAILSSATICNGTSATLIATGGSSYRFSEGTTNTTGILIVSPTTNGSTPYSVTVTSAQGCSAVATGTVTVNPSITATVSSATICNGTSATLTASGAGAGGSYMLNPGSLTSTAGTFVVTPTTNGVNTYTLTASSQFGCTDTKTGTITVNPSVTATLTSATICNGISATLTASGGTNYRFNTGITNTTGILIVLPTTNGANPYSVTVTSAQGCSAVASGTVTVNPSVTAILSSATICNGTSATLTASGAGTGGNYVLNPGSLTSTTGSFVLSPTTNGVNTYTLTATSQFGCAGTAIGTITVNPSVTATLSSATICNGTSATLTATGDSNYRFSEGTTNTTGVLVVAPTVNGSNPYSVTVTSAQGCSAVATGTVTVNASVTATLSSATICNGASTTLTATGGSNYRFSTGQTGTGNILVVSPTTNGANPYSVTVTSAQGCSAVATGTVTVNASVTATLSSATICNGASTTLTATGGSNYRFSTGQTGTGNILVVSPTTNGANPYSVTVTSAQGCSAVATGTVTVNPLPQPTISGSTSVCAGQPISLTANPTTGLTYAWSGPGGNLGSSNPLIIPNSTPANSGAYRVVVTDVNGCTAAATQNVTVKPVPQVQIVNTSITCANNMPAVVINTQITGGTPPVSYAWYRSGAAGVISTSPNPAFSTADTYSVVVTDASGCVSNTATVTIMEPDPLAVNIQTTNPRCFSALGTITVTTNGGTAPYTVSYRNASGPVSSGSTSSISTLQAAAGSYTVVVTDANGCSLTQTATLTQPSQLSLTLTGGGAVCAGQTTGSISSSVAGGTPSYTYLWSTGATTPNLTGLSGGSYSVVVTDANSCTISGSVTLPTNPLPATPTVTVTQPTCVTVTGTITVQTPASGVQYSFDNGGSYQVSPSRSGLSPAVYQVRVKDNTTGCVSLPASATVNPVPNPPVVSIAGITTLCAGRPISLTASPTTSVTYVWSGPGGASGTANPFVIVNSTTANSGTYQVVVTDGNGCTAVASTSVVVNPLPVATLTASATVVCAGQPVNLTAGGGNSYVFSANVAGVSGNTASFTAGVGTAQYSVTATSAQGCTAVASTTVTVNPTPQLTVNSVTLCAGTTGTLTATGCTGGTLVWSTGDNTPSLLIAPSVTTVYSATCTFTTGCSATVSTTATVNASPAYDLSPTATPATCAGLVANNNARIDLTTLQNTERADSSPGSTYTGPAYGAASNKLVSGGAVSFTGLANPGSPQTYTIRLFTPLGTCFRDVPVVLNPADCQCPVPGCVQVVVQEVR